MPERAHRLPLLCLLSLCFLLLGLFACSDGTEAEEDAAASPSAQAQAGASPAPGAAPGQAGAPGTPGGPAAAPPSGPPMDPAQIPAVVAKMPGGQEIKKEELLKEAQGIQAQLAARGNQLAPSQDFYRRVLDTIIAQRLLLAAARAEGINVPDSEVKAQVDGLRGRFPDAATFQKALQSQGMTEATMTQQLRDQLLLRQYIATKVLPEVQVTDAQARQFYDQNQDQMKRPEQRHLRHILIATPQGMPEADRQKARAKAEDLRGQLEKGGDFAQLAAANSDDPGSKVRGGDLGWVERGQTVPPFEQAAWALQPNQLSPVVESPFGFHLIQLAEPPRPESVVPFEQARDRILGLLRQRGTQEAVKAHADALRAQAKVEVFI